MRLKPNLNIGFYFIRNGSLTRTENVFSHVKLNLKLSLFQNLDLDYSLSPLGDHANDFSISLFCKIPKSKILTKKKIWSRGGMPREATLLNVQYGRFEVLSDPKTLYVQGRFLGQGKDNFPQRHKTKPMDKAQPTHTPRNLKLYQLMPIGPTWGSMHSLKREGGVLGDCIVYAFFLGIVGFGFWAKIKSFLTGRARPSYPSTRSIRHQSLDSCRPLKK